MDVETPLHHFILLKVNVCTNDSNIEQQMLNSQKEVIAILCDRRQTGLMLSQAFTLKRLKNLSKSRRMEK
jgi:hypothetical protein